jgi:hypothetical protein
LKTTGLLFQAPHPEKKVKLIDETETIIVNITYKLYMEDFYEKAKMWLKTHLSEKRLFSKVLENGRKGTFSTLVNMRSGI